MRRSIALRTLALALAAPILFVGALSAQEITASRVQAESKTQGSTTRIFQPEAEPVVNTTPNALRHDGNVTVTYDVSVPAGASVNAVKVRSR
jgi:hypothetical protein